MRNASTEMADVRDEALIERTLTALAQDVRPKTLQLYATKADKTPLKKKKSLGKSDTLPATPSTSASSPGRSPFRSP
jgi:hypothetical protein